MQKVVNYEVAGYPDCMDTGCNVMAVICHDEHMDQYAVYVGVVRLPLFDPDNPDDYKIGKEIASKYVARMGTKQTEAQARNYFPNFPKGKYRE